MKYEIAKIADFTTKMIIVFVTLVSIVQYAAKYNGFVFGFLGVLFLLSIISKGLVDIFAKRE